MSAAIGYGINAPNAATHYRSGHEAHLELAVGYRFPPHWELGLAGYTYRQVSGDEGAGARLGTLEGRVSGAGPALNYARRIGAHAVVVTARYYEEFDAKRHFAGHLALATFTVRL